MKNLLVPVVKVFRDGRLQEIDSSELVPGDVIQISEGDKVMADCKIIHNNELEINEAILTGESLPQKKISEKVEIQIKELLKSQKFDDALKLAQKAIDFESKLG